MIYNTIYTYQLNAVGHKCSGGSCHAHEVLISGFSTIEAETRLVQIRLKLLAATVIRFPVKMTFQMHPIYCTLILQGLRFAQPSINDIRRGLC